MARGQGKPELHIREILGGNIRLAREFRGFSQRELCNKAEVGQAYLCHCEAGQGNIGVDNIARLARALEVQPHDLLNPSFQISKRFKR
jgi:transcriptional regulator with XRE-family HTH domain